MAVNGSSDSKIIADTFKKYYSTTFIDSASDESIFEEFNDIFANAKNISADNQISLNDY